MCRCVVFRFSSSSRNKRGYVLDAKKISRYIEKNKSEKKKQQQQRKKKITYKVL